MPRDIFCYRNSNDFVKHVIRCSSCGCPIPGESFGSRPRQCDQCAKCCQLLQVQTSAQENRIRKVRKEVSTENRSALIEEYRQGSSFSNNSAEASPTESSESFSAEENDNPAGEDYVCHKRKVGNGFDESYRSCKQRKKAMSMKEGLFKLLERSKEQSAHSTPLLSWLPDGKSFLIHDWDNFVVAMSKICGQSFKALASNLSKFGFNRQKNRERSPQQRFYTCPPGFDIMSRFEDLKKVTSKTNRILQSQPLDSSKDTSTSNSSTGTSSDESHEKNPSNLQKSTPLDHSIKAVEYSNHTLLSKGEDTRRLDCLAILANWPPCVQCDEERPIRFFLGHFGTREESFREKIYALLRSRGKNAPFLTLPFTSTVQMNCGDLYLIRPRSMPSDNIQWVSTPHRRVTYRTRSGQLQIEESNHFVAEDNVVLMRQTVWISQCGRFKKHEYVLVEGQPTNGDWNILNDSPVIFCYFINESRATGPLQERTLCFTTNRSLAPQLPLSSSLSTTSTKSHHVFVPLDVIDHRNGGSETPTLNPEKVCSSSPNSQLALSSPVTHTPFVFYRL